MPRPRLLMIQPDAGAAEALAARLQRRGLACSVADSGLAGWRELAAARPDLMLVALGSPELGELLRRLRDEYIGLTPPIVALSPTEVPGPGLSRMDPAAVVIGAVDPDWITALAAAVAGGGESLDLGRLREMLRLTTLGGELRRALENLARRLRLIYGVAEAVVVANASERQWVASSRGPTPLAEWPGLWQLCARAVKIGAPLITRSGGDAQTQFAAPLLTANGEIVGALCLVANGARIFDPESREALEDLAGRIGAELAWRSVHDRVAGERDKLRETAMFDPLLGVASRAALDQNLAAEIARYHRGRSALSLAVLDVAGLQMINDRHGHVVGDAVLRHVAVTARALVRPHDLVGRVGGDEIAVIMGDTGAGEARGVINRVIQVLDRRSFRPAAGPELRVEVRAGLAELGSRDEDGAAFLARAIEASILAKDAGEPVVIAAGDERSRAARAEVGFEPGATLAGMYEIVHEISRGAMGVVYRAEDLGLSRPVAIKMLRPDLVREEGVVARFRQEAGILASLSHDHLVRIYSFIEEADDVFFVMELVEGVSLHTVINDFISRKRYLARERVGGIVSQIASALDEMHNAGVMHRDVKPSNVVLDRTRDRAVLVDVGLARHLGSETDAAGTPGYVAPESFRGGTETPATDVYGLAATTYTLLVNRPPFGNDEDVRAILRRQLSTPPRPASLRRSDVTTGTDAVLLRALSTDPRDRFSTAGAFAQALEDSFSATDPHIEMPSASALPEYLSSSRSRSAATARPARSTQTLTFVPSMAPAPSDPSAAHSRGVLFRTAAQLLGGGASLDDPEIEEALSSRTAPSAWIPSDHFFRLLESVERRGADPHAFAAELGATAVRLSFQRFYPSSPESLSPQATLTAGPVLWRRYHTWGQIEVEVSDEREAMLALPVSPNRFVCDFVRGWLAQVILESGGTSPAVQHPSCAHRGDPGCAFVVSWEA